ncbi:hypothetical protein AX15_002053 [Amanita polypyramis BW_CC]|nr:hypothetical protein AX15_002053 [Amanita polypyramis BW_CC]
MATSLQLTSILRLFVFALSYGIYFTTTIHCLRWLLYKGGGQTRREKGNISMLAVCFALFLFETVGLAAYFKATLEAQNLNNRDYNIFNTVYDWLEAAIYQIVDAVQIYRCWVVYNHSWKIIIFPVVFWFSCMALSGYGYYLCLLKLGGAANKSSLLSQIWGGFFACSMVISIYATTAIVLRIVPVARKSNDRTGRLHQTWRIVAESGALHTFSSIINLIANMLFSQNLDSERYEIFLMVIDPIGTSMAGIAFNLISIRVGQQRRRGTVVQDKTSDSQFIGRNGGQLSTMQFHSTETADSTDSTDSTLSEDLSVLHFKVDKQEV